MDRQHHFSFSDDDLNSFVKEHKATAAAKEMLPSQRYSVDERLAIQKVEDASSFDLFPKGLRQPYSEHG